MGNKRSEENKQFSDLNREQRRKLHKQSKFRDWEAFNNQFKEFAVATGTRI